MLDIMPISTLPQSVGTITNAWKQHLETIKNHNATLTWRNPLQLLTNKISSPSQIELDALLNILNNHISKWRDQKSPDITHFEEIINNNLSYKSIVMRTLYECMEKNKLNTDFINSNSYFGFMFDSNFVTCKNLLKTGKYSELDKLSPTKEYLNCLNKSPRGIILLLQSPEHKLQLSKLETRQLVTAIFANPTIYDTLLTQQNEKDHDVWNNFLCKDKNYNFKEICINFEKLFATKEEQLCCLAGLTCFTLSLKQFPDITAPPDSLLNELGKMFEQKFPSELKVLNTLLSIGFTDFNLIMSNLIQTEHVHKIEPVDLPTLF